jgi:radical SAM superfamily enzyme YgiQ (UPF0313 family)
VKVCLIKPCWSYPVDKADSTYNRIWPPLSLVTTAALLRREGHDVEVLDANALRLDAESVLRHAQSAELVVITTSSLDRWQCPNIDLTPIFELTRRFREAGKPFFVCGTHGTVRPRAMLEQTGARAVIRGEPEETILDLARDVPLGECPGLTFLGAEGVVETAPRPALDLTSLPIPAFDLLDYDKYFYEVLGERFNLFEASRGCPYACIFCVKSMYGDHYRCKSLEQLLAEVDYCLDERGIESAYFIDLEFTLNRELVLGLCRHLKARGAPLRWCCQTRLDSIDPELLREMREAGCELIHFGVETGVEELAKTLKKGIPLARIREGVRMTKAAGIDTVCFFMFGLPGETRAEMQRTIRLARQLNPTYASFHIALPYPGTEFHEQVRDELDDSLFPSAYTGVYPLPELMRIVRRAFISYYLRPRYLLSRLRRGRMSSLLRQASFFLRYFKARLLG